VEEGRRKGREKGGAHKWKGGTERISSVGPPGERKHVIVPSTGKGENGGKGSPGD